MAVYPPGATFASWDCDEAQGRANPFEFHSTWGDGLHIVWEGSDGRLWIEYAGCFDEAFEGDSELGFRHTIFSGAAAAQKFISLDNSELLTDEVVSRPSAEEIAARQTEIEAKAKAEAEAKTKIEEAKVKRVEAELSPVPGVTIKRETDKALLVTTAGREECWFPKSQTRIIDGVFHATAWILGQKGWSL